MLARPEVDPPIGQLSMQPTSCPICETSQFDREVYAMNFALADLTAQVFSARRLPDGLHYRMVRCERCNLLRSDPILAPSVLAMLYEASQFTYAAEAEFARATYGDCLTRALAVIHHRDRLLEIGCGSGFFLAEARARGFREVAGVEPSRAAIAHAPVAVRDRIRPELYAPTSFPREHFDVVCGFQVLDHAPDPRGLLAACHNQLRAGGVALFVNHDCGALSARLLGERSPIIDVEHTVLFDKDTMRRMFVKQGFRVHEVFAVRNRYPLAYWTKLAPLPAALKSLVLATLERSGMGRIPLALRAGNLGIIAVKD